MRAAAKIVCLAGAVLLAGCGFTPRDARRDDQAYPALAAIVVEPVKYPEMKLDKSGISLSRAREAQVLRTALVRRLNPTGRPVPQLYSLVVTTTMTQVSRGTRPDDSSLAYDYTLTGNFTLKRRTVGADESLPQTVFRGTSQAVTRQNTPYALYAAYVSQEAAADRAAEMLADDIANQLAAFFRYPDRYPAPKTSPAPEAEKPTSRPQRP